jgi:AcrR family transcriptional regulator
VTESARRLGRPRSEQAEQAILDATMELMAAHGFRALTIEAVAARAGVAKTTVYRRWGGKDELVLDVLSRLKGPVASPAGQGVRDDLVLLLDRVRQQWISGPHGRLMQQLSAEGLEQPDLYRQFRERLIAPRHAVLLSVLQAGVDQGLIRVDLELRWVLDLLVAPIVAAAFTHQGPLTRRQVEFNVDTVLAGLAPD